MGETTAMKKPELVVRWSLGVLCLAIEVVVVSIVIAALSRRVDTDGLFFWHPVLMTIGVILFLSHGVRSYISYAGVSRKVLRVVHGVLSGLWVCLSMAGFGIIVQYKRNVDGDHFGSTHSRLGLAVLFFSLVQGVAGTLKLSVLFANNKERAPHLDEVYAEGWHWLLISMNSLPPIGVDDQRFLRWHGRMGTLVFASAITTFLTGVSRLLEGGPEQNTAIATYVLTFVLALLALFPDFFAKGGDVVPEAAEGESGYIRLNDASPNTRTSSNSPNSTLQFRF